MSTTGTARVTSYAGPAVGSQPDTRFVVGVVPARARAERRRLFAALEHVFPVRFEGRAPEDLRDLDGVVAFDSLPARCAPLPNTPLLIFHGSDTRVGDAGGGRVELGRSGSVSPLLRGRSIPDREAQLASPVPVEAGDEVLATCARRPIWTRRHGAYLSALPPRELQPAETLRDLFRSDDFMSLLPLVHVLGQMSAALGWVPPPLRAAIVLDDPNLHWTSYGHVRFAALVEHARAHRHHVAVATIPLDLWYFDRRAARIFRENPEVLSLAVHGNTHVRRELARVRTETEAVHLVAQVLGRVERFERRSGVRLSRVMVPPHGDCNQTALGALALKGFDAVCWWPKPRSVLSGFEVAEFADGGLPSIPRTLLGRWDDLPFRAYLHQPIVLEGHHHDLAEGLEVLEKASVELDRLGDPEWMSLGGIAETNVAVRRARNTLHVRMFSRRVLLTIPEGVELMVVETSPYAGHSEETIVVRLGGPGSPVRSGRLFEGLPVVPGTAELRLVRPSSPSEGLQARSWRPWPVVRRFLSEGRDRTVPAVTALERRAKRIA